MHRYTDGRSGGHLKLAVEVLGGKRYAVQELAPASVAIGHEKHRSARPEAGVGGPSGGGVAEGRGTARRTSAVGSLSWSGYAGRA